MRRKHSAFTLIEVLVSITLLSFVLMTLYRSVDSLRASNKHLYQSVIKSSSVLKGSRTLYKDLMHSDHNISINKEEKFHRVTIQSTTHSLHGQDVVKVVWLIYKEDKALLRLEGGKFDVPLRNEQRVEVDVIAKNMELFQLYKGKGKEKILAILKIKGQDPQVFMVQNIPLKPPKKKKKPKKLGNKNVVNNKEPIKK